MKKSLLFIILGGIGLLSCGRGCTTTTVMDSEEKEMTVDGQDVLVTAEVLDYRHSRGKKNNIFDRTVTHSYGMNMKVDLNNVELGDFYHEAVADPENVDLDKHLKRVKVKISKDKNHFALGVGNTVAEVFHLYKGQPFTMVSASLIIPEKTAWSDLDIESFPSPREIVYEQLDECGVSLFSTEAIFQFLDDCAPDDKMHMKAISKWPECSSLEKYYDEKRTRKFIKNKKWKQAMVAQGLKVVRSDQVADFEKKEIYTYLDQFNSSQLQYAMDSVLVSVWGGLTNEDLTPMLIGRLKSRRKPMNESLKKKVVHDAYSEFKNYQQTRASFPDKEPSECLEIILALGDTTVSEGYFKQIYDNPGNKIDYDDFEIVYTNLEACTPAQQAYVVDRTDDLLDVIDPDDRDRLVQKAAYYFDCPTLKKWRKKYPRDIDDIDLPLHCR